MKKANFEKIGIATLISLGFIACSTVGPADVDENSEFFPPSNTGFSSGNDSIESSASGSQEQETGSSDSQGQNIESSESEAQESSSSTSTVESDKINLSNPDKVLFDTPAVSAIIFKQDSGEFEFRLVVHGNLPTYATIEAENTSDIVIDFRWNNDTPDKWDHVKISNSDQIDFATDWARTFNTLNDLCHSYASARITWTNTDGKEIHTEWSDPAGPLYTLTQQDSRGKTEFTFTENGDNPCTGSR